MIIKLLQNEVIDGKLRVKGEVVRVKSFDGEYKLIRKEEKNNQKEIKSILKAKKEKLKDKKNGKTK